MMGESKQTQFYIGVKKIEAYPEEKDGKPGYAVVYSGNYKSWSPKEVFEAAYLPMGFGEGIPVECLPQIPIKNSNRITQAMVDDFIAEAHISTLGPKTTVVRAVLKNGFEIVESSACVDPANYSESVGAEICLTRIKNQVWHLLGFALQWAHAGLKTKA